MTIRNVLSIAGSDPSGGAGIQADLKTFAACGCYGMAALTALTAQNTQGVQAIHVPPADFVAAQIASIFADIEVHAVKIGMLGSGAVAAAVAAQLAHRRVMPIVLDPVLAATSGDSLALPDLIDVVWREVVPLATLVTPNLPEAAWLLGEDAPPHDVAGMQAIAERLRARGARAVLVKGGHLDGDTADDVFCDGNGARTLSSPRITTRHTHGTGCTLSSAIAAGLAQGATLPAAIDAAKRYLGGALAGADTLAVGHGHGPLHHFHALWKRG